jgi:hypothetical protein
MLRIRQIANLAAEWSQELMQPGKGQTGLDLHSRGGEDEHAARPRLPTPAGRTCRCSPRRAP